MASRYQALPGMDDILPNEVEKWQWLETYARHFLETQGFQEIRTPILEPTELFMRSIGTASDIVHKEMYTFEDSGGRRITMRPEMTASVARAVIEKGLLKTAKSLRLYYIGPMFRAERPQAGRKRQFHQIGAEIINESGVQGDCELIVLAYRFLLYAQAQDVRLRLNDLSAVAGSKQINQKLKQYFDSHRHKLCPDCLYRLERNVLRIFDCKKAKCQPVIGQAPWEEIAPLSTEFQEVEAVMRENKIPYEVDRRLVRGLDYYTGIVYEFTAGGLGAQNAVAGGGRYDKLYRQLGGPDVPCTGCSVGMERLLMSIGEGSGILRDRLREKYIYLAPLITPEAPLSQLYTKVVDTALALRRYGYKTLVGKPLTKLSDHLKKANKWGAKYFIILGPEEFEKQHWAVKNMDTGEQNPVRMGELLTYLKEDERL